MSGNNESIYFDKMYMQLAPSSVEGILRLCDKLGNYVFRGHATSDWKLRTTFERAAARVPPEKWAQLERKVITEFKRRAQHYLPDLPRRNQHLEWLALMQHHGCPTRLLDFTRSCFIALFFAVEDTTSDSCVWAVNRTFFEYRPGIPASDDHLYSAYNKHAEKSVNAILSPGSEEEQKSGVLLAEPYRMNERLSIQQGLFLLPKNLRVSFEANLCEPLEATSLDQLAQRDGTPVIVKIVIPKQLHLKTILFLNTMNISAATLFPGLDGYARSQKQHIQSAELSIQEQRRVSWVTLERLLKGLVSKRHKPPEPPTDTFPP